MNKQLNDLESMQRFFAARKTFDYHFRREQLIKLKEALYQYEKEIYEALYTDLKKNPEECWVTEIGFVITEINYALKCLKRWMKPKRVNTNLLNFPSRSYVLNEPLGVALIIGPWNYPLQLLLVPLAGAIAAGNCAVIKPSEYAPATAALLKRMFNEHFDPAYIKVVTGEGAVVIPHMMHHFRFDHVFFTGGTEVGRAIYEMAARQLTPVTLELSGKSPCIIEADANIKVSAKRIALTKFSNAGQMCVAPDYLLVHQSKIEELIEALKNAIDAFYNAADRRDYHYGKIINAKHFARLKAYLQSGRIVYGGGYDEETLFIEPTLLADVPADAPVMQEEIFGPLLPIISWEEEEDVYQVIEKNKNPLALYVFSSNEKKSDYWLTRLAFGGGCMNNASWHITNPHLPFGGRGNSGIGRYHGRYSFDTFSHQKAIMKTPTWFDPDIKYPPFKGKLKWFKKLIK